MLQQTELSQSFFILYRVTEYLVTDFACCSYLMGSLHIFVFELSFIKLLVTFRKLLNLLSCSRF